MDNYAVGSNKLTSYMEVKRATEAAVGSGDRASLPLHANDARSSGSGARLVQEPTIGSSVSKPKTLGLLSVVWIDKQNTWRLWKDQVFADL